MRLAGLACYPVFMGCGKFFTLRVLPIDDDALPRMLFALLVLAAFIACSIANVKEGPGDAETGTVRVELFFIFAWPARLAPRLRILPNCWKPAGEMPSYGVAPGLAVPSCLCRK
jgi:hypothetical protein